MELTELLKKAVAMGGSDVFIIPGACVEVKVENTMLPISEERLMPKDTDVLVQNMYGLAHRDYEFLERGGGDDFSFPVQYLRRLR